MCEGCDWEEYRDKADDLISTDLSDTIYATVDGIMRWVEENEHVTENQKRALNNIESNAMRVHTG